MVRTVRQAGGLTLGKVRLDVEDHIGIITLHNPPRNTLDAQVQREILAVCEAINQDDDIWVCILCSDLDTFSVGFDVKLFKQSVVEKDVTNIQEVFYDGALALYELRVPLICAVHGHCLGGALCYAAGSDISIAAEGTRLGIPEINLSVTGGSGHLARMVPPQIMRNMAYTGTFLTAEELAAFGGLTMVVPRDDLMPAAKAKALELCAKGPLVLRYFKACMNRQEDFQMRRKNDLEITYTRYMARHGDFGESLDAFLEKRPPSFSGV
jgi:Enoyl-CoA hydratase/carnithine racemase